MTGAALPPYYAEKRANAKNDIRMITEPDSHSLYFVWEDGGIAVRLSEIHENSRGLGALFAAECPIGIEVKSGIKVSPDSEFSRKSTIKAMHDPALGLDFKEWDPMIETAFAETVRAFNQVKEQEANAVPEALTADDILALETPETPWVIKDILPKPGVSLLASLPKKGKTVFVLNIIKAAQAGEKFLDREVPKMRILYLALEDTKSRLKTRLAKLGISGKQVTFILECDLTRGLEPLRRLIETYHPDIVIIDTLLAALHIKDENSPELGIAAQELHDLARDMDVGILILHHHGKSKRDDPILDLRGHTSLSGAVDVILGLYAEETPGQFKLKSASRDGESLDLDLAFDGSALRWVIDTNYNEVKKIESDSAMLELLTKDTRLTLKEIGEINRKSDTPNNIVLQRLLDSGDVKRERASKDERGFAQPFVYFRARGGKG